MKAMIFAAGLGTRLRPLTDQTPKALVPINGLPLLEIVIRQLKQIGVSDIIVNVHHHSQQIIDFLKNKNHFDINIAISDETDLLLDTGGGLKKAAWFFDDGQPFLVHNVDILSNIDLEEMFQVHLQSNALATLATRQRATTRYFIFNKKNRLGGWVNVETGKVIFSRKKRGKFHLSAFSGIHILSPDIFDLMPEGKEVFSIVDVYLAAAPYQKILAFPHDDSSWLDVGKVENLEEGGRLLKNITLS